MRVLALASLAFAATSTEAQTSTWTGNGGNVNWGTAGNWTPSAPVAASATTDLIFAGTTNTGTAGTPLNQNIAINMILNSLTFSSGGAAFFLGGNAVLFDGSSNTITQNSSSAESIANDISHPNTNVTVTITLAGSGTGVVTLGGAISIGNSSRDYAILKTGSSTFVLSGANTYTGSTTVNAGSLFVNGSTASGSAVTVNNSGSTLGGSGTINGTVNVASSGANLSPGASGVGSTGILRTGALTLASGSNFNVDINGITAGTGYDQVVSPGTTTIDGSNLLITAGSGLTVGSKFFILEDSSNNANSYGTFANTVGGTVITATNNTDTFLINYADNGDGGFLANDISLTVTAVPEPSTCIAGVLSLAGLLWNQRRRLRRGPAIGRMIGRDSLA